MTWLVNPYRFATLLAGEHSYWQIVPLGFTSDVWSIANIQLRTSVSGTDVAPTATSITDNNVTQGAPGGHTTAVYVDGNAATWRGGDFTEQTYIRFQFSGVVTIREVAITSKSGSSDAFYLQTPCAFSVLGSDDGTNWYCYGVFTPTWTAYSQTKTFTLLTTALAQERANAHAWRIEMTELQSGTGSARASFGEMIWAASPGGPTLCTGGGPIISTAAGTSESGDKLFDGTTARWVSRVEDANWLAGYAWSSATNVAQLRIQVTQSGGDLPRAPKSFNIQYSVDGWNWTTTDTVTGEAAWTTNETRSYSVSS